MRRDDATKLCRAELDKHALNHWKIHLHPKLDSGFIGMCVHKDKTIFLNMHAIDIHPDAEILNTFRHEIAHALVGPGHAHNEVWQAKAKEIGCDNTSATCSIGLSAAAVEALRSGDMVEAVVEEEIVRKVDYRITRLQDKCEKCGKVAKEKGTTELPGLKIIMLECGHPIFKVIPKPTPFETLTFDGDPNCKHEWPYKINPFDGTKLRGTVCSKCDAKRPYLFQVEGMRALEIYDGRFAILDEMGLGKSIQSTGYLKFHPEKSPFLWLCKSGLKYQAAKEIVRVMGMEYMPYIIETGKDHIFPGFKCYVASFDILRRLPQNKLEQLSKLVKTVVIDEVQHIKNPDSTRTQEVRRLCKEMPNIIPLSGGPWKNRGSEFYVMLNLVNRIKFHSFEGFKQNWVQYYYDGNKLKEGGIKNPARFKEFCKDVFVRRERVEVMKELPLINRTKLYCRLPKEAQEAYDEATDSFVKIWNQLVIGGDEGSFAAGSSVMGALNTMRQIVGIAKIPATLEYATEFLENTADDKRKLLIFVHHIAVGEAIYQSMKEYGDANSIKVVRLTSSMNGQARFDMQEQFNNDADTRVAVLSTLAAGEGLNLQTCSDGIMHERQWNPLNEEQPEGRMIRIGQKSQNVNMTYAEAEGTVDADLDGIVSRKRIQFHVAMNNGEMPVWNQNSIIKELGNAIAAKWKYKKAS